MLRAGHHADRRQILQRVIRHAREQARVDGQRHGLQADGVAIRRRLGDRIHTDIAARAGAVLHHEGAAEALRPGIRNQARGDVCAATGGVGHDQADRALRIGLGRGRAHDGGAGEQGGTGEVAELHGVVSFWIGVVMAGILAFACGDIISVDALHSCLRFINEGCTRATPKGHPLVDFVFHGHKISFTNMKRDARDATRRPL
ncbi:hypothetical protein D3C87_1493420 [compost metagenome]